jgi:hypothetical protein
MSNCPTRQTAESPSLPSPACAEHDPPGGVELYWGRPPGSGGPARPGRPAPARLDGSHPLRPAGGPHLPPDGAPESDDLAGLWLDLGGGD